MLFNSWAHASHSTSFTDEIGGAQLSNCVQRKCVYPLSSCIFEALISPVSKLSVNVPDSIIMKHIHPQICSMFGFVLHFLSVSWERYQSWFLLNDASQRDRPTPSSHHDLPPTAVGSGGPLAHTLHSQPLARLPKSTKWAFFQFVVTVPVVAVAFPFSLSVCVCEICGRDEHTHFVCFCRFITVRRKNGDARLFENTRQFMRETAEASYQNKLWSIQCGCFHENNFENNSLSR